MKLEKLLELYNFKLYRQDLEIKEDSATIRIYLNYDMWFEFGIYDWFENDLKMKNIKKILSNDILNKEVDCFKVNDDNSLLCVYLKSEDDK